MTHCVDPSFDFFFGSYLVIKRIHISVSISIKLNYVERVELYIQAVFERFVLLFGSEKVCCVFETFVEYIMSISRDLDIVFNTGNNNNFDH